MATRAWFIYTGGGSFDSENYKYVPIQPNCSGGKIVCSILGVYEPAFYNQHPAPFTFSNIYSYIKLAIATGIAQPTGPEPYVLVQDVVPG